MRAGDRGFLAAVLGPGMRATTVGVDAVTGTAGLIWPGDHVDLILTETIDDPAAPLGRRIAGETVLHNVRVIAIDQELMQGANAANATYPNAASQSRTVTLEVSPANAERIAVATRLGHLSLSVISADIAEAPIEPTTPIIPAALTNPTIPSAPLEVTVHAPITWGSDVSSALRSGRKGDPVAGMLRVFDGSTEGKEYHFQ
jgi:pilus assembly protein CpaB